MSSEDVQRLTGMVKWFNNKSGFGFITVSGTGEYAGKDIFAHYSSIRVTNSQYKYLVQGEYVDFNLVKSESDTHEYQASDITGVMNGPILCETRRQVQAAQGDSQRERKQTRRPRADKEESADTPSESRMEASEDA
jgi:cold shock CspA family protein